MVGAGTEAHDESPPGGREHRVILAVHPCLPREEEPTAPAAAPPDGRVGDAGRTDAANDHQQDQ